MRPLLQEIWACQCIPSQLVQVTFGPIINFQFLLLLLLLQPNRSIGNKPSVFISQQSNRINMVESPVHITLNRDTTDKPRWIRHCYYRLLVGKRTLFPRYCHISLQGICSSAGLAALRRLVWHAACIRDQNALDWMRIASALLAVLWYEGLLQMSIDWLDATGLSVRTGYNK